MDGFHSESMPHNKGDTRLGTEISEPVPGEDTFDGHHQAVAVGSNGLEKGFWSGLHIAVEQDFSRVAQDTEGHGAGMQINATVKQVLIGVANSLLSFPFLDFR